MLIASVDVVVRKNSIDEVRSERIIFARPFALTSLTIWKEITKVSTTG